MDSPIHVGGSSLSRRDDGEEKVYEGVMRNRTIIFAIVMAVILLYQLNIFIYNFENMSPYPWSFYRGHSIFQTLFIIAILLLITATIGIFFLKQWARITAIIGAVMLLLHLIYLIYDLGGLNVMSAIVLIGHLADMGAPFILYFFTRPKVKALFSPPKAIYHG